MVIVPQEPGSSIGFYDDMPANPPNPESVIHDGQRVELAEEDVSKRSDGRTPGGLLLTSSFPL